MTKKIFKIILNLIIFITASFLFDLALHYFSNLKINRILIIHGTLYFAYGAFSLLSLFIFDSASTYAKLHGKETFFPLHKKTKNIDILFSIVAGLSLITLEALFH